MTKAKTHFPQVPVEIAKKVAAAESNGQASEPVKLATKKPNGSASADYGAVADEMPGADEDL